MKLTKTGDEAAKEKEEKPKLTKKLVEGIEPPEKGQLFVWDGEQRGFGVRVTSGSKTYIVQQRVNGKTRRVTIGQHGVYTAEQARKRAIKLLADMGDGTDPNARKREDKAKAVTLREVMEAYIADRSDLKPASVKAIRKHVEGRKQRNPGIAPAINLSDWADKPLTNINRELVRKRYMAMSERSVAQANQAMRNLRALWNYARAVYLDDREESILAENPVSVLSDAKLWKRVPAKSRKVPISKVGRVWLKLTELRQDPAQTEAGKTVADIVAFIMVTGVRWSDAAQLTADRINLDESWWFLPDPKNRIPIKLPLSSAAANILRERDIDDGFMFPARSGEGHISEPRAIWDVLSEIAGERVSAHDLRRTFVAIAGELGVELWRTKLLFGQKVHDVAVEHYTETSDLRYLAPEAQKIADWIEAEGRKAAAGNVVSIRA